MKLIRQCAIILALLLLFGMGSFYPATARAAQGVAHSNLPPVGLDNLPLTNRVAELIFQLRDLKNEDRDGWADIFTDAQHGSNTAAGKLAAIGYPAVPQLIDALTNRTPTRYLAKNWDHSELPPTLLTVDDCCFQILRRISGLRFWDHRIAANLAHEPNFPAIRADIEAWYADFQKTGEKEFLTQLVVKGNADSINSAKRLLERYPDAGEDAIIKGVEAVKTLSLAQAEASLQNRWPNQTMPEGVVRMEVSGSEAPRSELLGLLADSDLKDEKITEFLFRELRDAPDLNSRRRAAEGLRRRGQPEGVAAMLKEWPAMVKKEMDHGNNDVQTSFQFRWLEMFLGASDSPETVEALRDNLTKLDASDRMLIVRDISLNRPATPPAQKAEVSPATLAALEKFYASVLDDTESAANMGAYLDGHNYPDIRICDLAAYWLAQGWPDRYHFDIAASRKVHERQRIECLNVLRTAHHEAPLPLPVEATQHVSEADALKVTGIEWATNGAKPSAAFVARMESLKNKLLTVEAFKAVVEDYQANPEPGSSGLDLQARKDEDLTGVTIVVRLIPGTTPTPRGWSYHKQVSLGNESLLSNGSSGPAGMLDDLGWNAKRALAAPPATPFLIQATVTSYAYTQR